MTQITLSTSQTQQLDAGPALVECRDPAGKLIGLLHVSGTSGNVGIPDMTAEELERFEREPGGRPLADILNDLLSRR